MHVIHTCTLVNKEYILFYMLALSEGLDNQADTSTCTSNTFSAYIYKKDPCAELEGERVGKGRGSGRTVSP